ncbi:MAG: Hsp20/alpha crystallin family protein [Opitutus sp.]|nr:Hsp20/alpha crystallin family protein [Opitutus sp.]
MHTIIHPLASRPRPTAKAPASTHAFRQPAYVCQEKRDKMKLVVYVPGVEAAGVEVEGHGADLTVTARKPLVVRVNWQALHLESAQNDYRLRLRLGTGFDYAAMRAEISHGVLTVTLPKRAPETAPRLQRVA